MVVKGKKGEKNEKIGRKKVPKTKKRESNLNASSTAAEQKQTAVSPEHIEEDRNKNANEKVVLPPLGGNNNDVISARDSLEDNTGSPTQAQFVDDKPLSYEQALSNTNDVDGDPIAPSGVLNKGMLTRRMTGEPGFADPGYIEPYYGSGKLLRRPIGSRLSNLAYDHGYPDPATYNGRYASNPQSHPSHPYHIAPTAYSRNRLYAGDKVVSFYKSINSTHPELKLVIKPQRHRNLADVMDDVCRRIFLNEREKYIHTSLGTILNSVDDFEDGGIYFFGPPHTFDLHDYDHFHKTNSPAHSATGSKTGSESLFGGNNNRKGDSAGSKQQRSHPFSEENFKNGGAGGNENKTEDNGNNNQDETKIGGGSVAGESSREGVPPPARKRLSNIGELRLKRRRVIKILVNHDPRSLCSFMVDEMKHRSVAQLLSDLTFQLNYRKNQIQRIVTPAGKVVLRIEDFLVGNDDHFVAIASGYNDYDPGYHDPGYHDPGYHDPTRDQRRFQNPYMNPVKIEAGGNSHVFDPPSVDYYDQIYRRGTDLYDSLQLDWVYGYNGKGCRNNIILLPSEEILYFVAKVAVVFNDQQQTQRFYTEHTDEIRSIAQHPNEWIVATGQISGGSEKEPAHVRIWDSKILVTLNVLDFDTLNMSIECMDFCVSDNGERLATVSTGNGEWYLTVWDWEDAIKLSHSEPYDDENADLDVEFDPSDSSLVVTCGKEHVFFWDVSQSEAVFEVGFFEDYTTPEYVTCLDFNEDGRVVTGDSNGNVHIWDAQMHRTISTVPTTHEGSIISIRALSNFYVVTGGGADRKLNLINLIESVPTQAEFQLPKHLGGIVSMVPLFNGFSGGEKNFHFLRMVLGTSSNCILAGSITESFECIVKGVSDVMPGFSVSPTENTFVTAGGDQTVTSWSTETKAELWEIKHEVPLTAVDYNSTGSVVAVGNSTGRWFVYEAVTGDQLTSFQCDRSAVTCISYSPENDFFAVGMETGVVFFYRIINQMEYKYFVSCKASQDEITSLNWSVDSRHLRIVNKSFDVMYWNMNTRRLENNRQVIRDLQYESETIPMSYQTSGVWANNEAGLNFKTADRKGTMLIVGGDTGVLRLYQYPCDVESNDYYKRVTGTAFNEVNLHSSEISKVHFFLNDRAALTCGLEDFCIAQWKLVRMVPQKFIEENRRYQYHPRYATDLQESLNASAYRNGMPRRGPPALAQRSARTDRETNREGNGSLSRSQLFKRETLQNVLLRKSINEK